MRYLDRNTVVLCRKGSCCPVVTKTESGIEITDDYNGKVILTDDEVSMLVKHLSDLQKSDSDN